MVTQTTSRCLTDSARQPETDTQLASTEESELTLLCQVVTCNGSEAWHHFQEGSAENGRLCQRHSWLVVEPSEHTMLRIPTVQLVPTVILSRSLEQLGQQLFFVICEKDQSQVNEKTI